MDMTIGVKTTAKDSANHIAYFGFFDEDAHYAGSDDPFRHVDGDYMETSPTVFGYRVKIASVYDITNGRYLNKEDMRNLRLMYVEFDGEYEKPERVWID